MVICTARHGIDQAAPIFVADLTLAFDIEIFFRADVVWDSNHKL